MHLAHIRSLPQLRDVVSGQSRLIPLERGDADNAQDPQEGPTDPRPVYHQTLPPRFPGTHAAPMRTDTSSTVCVGGRAPVQDQQQQQQQQQATGGAARDSENDPNFVSNFFSQSRLHFIGSWRLRHSNIVRRICSASLLTHKRGNETTKAVRPNEKSRADRRVVLHIDMDCFFAAVAVREEPSLRGLPLAICHGTGSSVTGSNAPFAVPNGGGGTRRPSSTSEISAASYAARQHGIKAGMYLGQAYKLCPSLVVRGYRFDLYESITSLFFELLLNSFSPEIEPVSCDEVYMDVSALVETRAADAKVSREEAICDLLAAVKDKIFEVTGCVASVGCGRNKLLAKMASKAAKPDGIVNLSHLQDDMSEEKEQEDRNGRLDEDRACSDDERGGDDAIAHRNLSDFMRDVPIRDLPGVGYVTASLLADADIHTCGDVMRANQGVIEAALSKDVHTGGTSRNAVARRPRGNETAQPTKSSSMSRATILRLHARGIDDRPVAISNVTEGQSSIGAEINYGIRFKTAAMLTKFMEDLAQEVVNRMKMACVVGRTLTVKVKKRRATAPIVTSKFLGHGLCDNLTRSLQLHENIGEHSCDILSSCSLKLLLEMQVPIEDLRGIGIVITRLSSIAPSRATCTDIFAGAEGHSGSAAFVQRHITYFLGGENHQDADAYLHGTANEDENAFTRADVDVTTVCEEEEMEMDVVHDRAENEEKRRRRIDEERQDEERSMRVESAYATIVIDADMSGYRRVHELLSPPSSVGAQGNRRNSKLPDIMFVRLAVIDWYMERPLPHFDPFMPARECERGANGRYGDVKVPILRIFGSTPQGQTCCCHVHGAFPYMYVKFDINDCLTEDGGVLDVKLYVSRFVAAAEVALERAHAQKAEAFRAATNHMQDRDEGRHRNGAVRKEPRVFGATLVRGSDFYGYHHNSNTDRSGSHDDTYGTPNGNVSSSQRPDDQLFIKILLYNPRDVQLLATLLTEGRVSIRNPETNTVVTKSYAVYESHIDFVLTYMTELNLMGMGFVRITHAMFRGPLPDDNGCPSLTHDSDVVSPPVPCTQEMNGNEAFVNVSESTDDDTVMATPSPTFGTHVRPQSSVPNDTLWTSSTVPARCIWPSATPALGDANRHACVMPPERQSCSTLEFDVFIDCIDNVNDDDASDKCSGDDVIADNSAGTMATASAKKKKSVSINEASRKVQLVKSLQTIWNEEKLRDELLAKRSLFVGNRDTPSADGSGGPPSRDSLRASAAGKGGSAALLQENALQSKSTMKNFRCPPPLCFGEVEERIREDVRRQLHSLDAQRRQRRQQRRDGAHIGAVGHMSQEASLEELTLKTSLPATSTPTSQLIQRVLVEFDKDVEDELIASQRVCGTRGADTHAPSDKYRSDKDECDIHENVARVLAFDDDDDDNRALDRGILDASDDDGDDDGDSFYEDLKQSQREYIDAVAAQKRRTSFEMDATRVAPSSMRSPKNRAGRRVSVNSFSAEEDRNYMYRDLCVAGIADGKLEGAGQRARRDRTELDLADDIEDIGILECTAGTQLGRAREPLTQALPLHAHPTSPKKKKFVAGTATLDMSGSHHQTFCLRYRYPPPTTASMMATFADYGLHQEHHEDPFLRRKGETDHRLHAKAVVNGQSLKVRVESIDNLEPFFVNAEDGKNEKDTSRRDSRLPRLRFEHVRALDTEPRSITELRVPLATPPSRAEVIAWMAAADARRRSDTKSSSDANISLAAAAVDCGVNAHAFLNEHVEHEKDDFDDEIRDDILEASGQGTTVFRPPSPKYEEQFLGDAYLQGNLAVRRKGPCRNDHGLKAQHRLNSSLIPTPATTMTTAPRNRAYADGRRLSLNFQTRRQSSVSLITSVPSADGNAPPRLHSAGNYVDPIFDNAAAAGGANCTNIVGGDNGGVGGLPHHFRHHQLRTMIVEVQTSTRGHLVSDPRYDAINVVVVSVYDDERSANGSEQARGTIFILNTRPPGRLQEEPNGVRKQVDMTTTVEDDDTCGGDTIPSSAAEDESKNAFDWSEVLRVPCVLERSTSHALQAPFSDVADANSSPSSYSEVVVLSVENEHSLLVSLIHLVRRFDPDILTSWEIQKAGIGYCCERWERRYRDSTAPGDGGGGYPHQARFGGDGRTVPVIDVTEGPFCRLLSRSPTHRGNSERGDDTYGWNTNSGIVVPGRIVLNLWRLMHGEVRLQSYTLQNVCAAVLKVVLPNIKMSTMFEWYLSQSTTSPSSESGGMGNFWYLARHMIRECSVMMRIVNTLDIINRTAELAKVFGIDFFSVVSRGSQFRVESMMARLAHRYNYLLPSPTKTQVANQPAMEVQPLVMEPMSKMYESPVVVLDFQSLYPSIIIAYNLCYSTCLGRVGNIANLAVPDIERVTSTAGLGFKEDFRVDSSVVEACGGADGVNVMPNGVLYTPPTFRTGVLPRLLTEILDTRVMVKEKLKKSCASDDGDDDGDGTGRQRMLNARQFALKLIANVTYGYTSAGYSGRMPMAELADSIVQAARDTLERAARLIEGTGVATNAGNGVGGRWPGAKVVYGDSVAGDTPLLLRINGVVTVKTIGSLASRWGNYHGDKGSCELDNVESWTESGWTAVQRVIRHKLPPGKRLVRVRTHCGNVVCTSDHSLLDESGNKVSPTEVSNGDKLLHSFPLTYEDKVSDFSWDVSFERKIVHVPSERAFNILRDTSQWSRIHVGNILRNCDIEWKDHTRKLYLTPSMARLLGMFVGDGSCGIYESSCKASWAINNTDMNLLETYRDMSADIFPEYEWKIMQTLKSSGVYKLSPRSRAGAGYGGIRRFITFWRDLCYNDRGEKRIHECILNSGIDCRAAFWAGLHDADGTKGTASPEISLKGSEISLAIVYLLRSLGHDHITVSSRRDKPNVFRMRARKDRELRKDPGRVFSIDDVTPNPSDGDVYVYDLTTSNHHFQAGVGSMIVHNTDSLFVMLEGRTRSEAFRIGREMAEAVTNDNPDPIKLKLEKVYHPCILCSKKRYVGFAYEDETSTAPFFDAKGIETVRRDSCPAVSVIVEKAIRTIFAHKDIDMLQQFLRRQFNKILHHRIPLHQFIFAKEVRLGTYKARNRANRPLVPPPAAVVAGRAMAIDPRAEPRMGERVPYVVIVNNNSTTGAGGTAAHHQGLEARLVDMVVSPHVVLESMGTMKIHVLYYLKKQIVPALMRTVGLVPGVDVERWLNELPSNVRLQPTQRLMPSLGNSFASSSASHGNHLDAGRIDNFFLSVHCPVCDAMTNVNDVICDKCAMTPGVVLSVLSRRAAMMAVSEQKMHAACLQCGGCGGGRTVHEDGKGSGHIEERGPGTGGLVACVSLDCPVYFDRVKVATEMANANRCMEVAASALERRSMTSVTGGTSSRPLRLGSSAQAIGRRGTLTALTIKRGNGRGKATKRKASAVASSSLSRRGYERLSFSQIDADVLAALPHDIQQEILSAVRM